jgi:hypothetical protein
MVKKILFAGFMLFATTAFSQSGPHMAASKIVKVLFSGDGKRMMTASYYDVAIWNLENFSVIRKFKYEDLGLPVSDDYDFAADPGMTLLWLKGFSKRTGALLDVEKWEYKTVGYSIDFISADHTGVSYDFSVQDTYLLDLATGAQTQIKGFRGYIDMSPDGKYVIVYSVKGKPKKYDFATKTVSTYKAESAGTQRVSYSANILDDKMIEFNPGKVTRKMVVGSNYYLERPRLVKIDNDRARAAILEFDYQSNEVYRCHLVFYSLPSGEVLKDIELNGPSGEAEKFNAAQKAAEEERQKQAEAARQQKLANARPGFLTFDSKFTNLSLPYTMDYNNAKGFSLAGDGFINSAMGMRAGSEIFGMGKICSCADHTSYLLMVQNKSASTDLSNFIVVSFDIDGTELGRHTIGATQKDPSGVIKLDFTIPTGCLGTVNAKMTYPNGSVVDKSFSFSGCIFN